MKIFLYRHKKKLRNISLLLLFAVLLIFIFRNTILHWAIDKTIAKFNKKFPAELAIKQATCKGISGVELKGITIKPLVGDTLFSCASVTIKLRLLPLFLLRVRVNELEIENTKITLNKKKSGDNFSFLLKKKNNQSVDSTANKHEPIDFGQVTNSLLQNVFDAIPAKLSIARTSIYASNDTAFLKTLIPTIGINNGNFNAYFYSKENSGESSWRLFGEIDKGRRTLNFKMVAANHQNNNHIPLLQNMFGLTLDFDTLFASLKKADYSDEILDLEGSTFIKGFTINHWRISPDDVKIRNANLQYHVNIGASFFELDSSSMAVVNDLHILPFFNYEVKNKPIVALNVNIPPVESQVFFDAFPAGLFQNFEGLKTSGKLGYSLQFKFNASQPDCVLFVSQMPQQKFKIESFGKSQLNKLNGEFLYTAYEKGKPVRSFTVGLSNPSYYPMGGISTYLQQALMTSEDGNFYSHNGFNEGAFKKSIAENYKQGRFARGGSTISMQLVKNVFLTRNKTIARKVEEALIVWLIEHNRLVSKQRMYEVYLNLIEWGPGVYGIGEAAQFYFNKTPNELTLAESIYLAMIVPRPKWFKYNFDESGQLKPHVADYYRIIANHLVRREIITEEQKEALTPAIELKGLAKNMVLKPDTNAMIDSLSVLE